MLRCLMRGKATPLACGAAMRFCAECRDGGAACADYFAPEPPEEEEPVVPELPLLEPGDPMLPEPAAPELLLPVPLAPEV